MNKSIVTIIPARGGSKGIIDKNIISLSGKPLLAWSIEQSLSSRWVTDTYVSTDSQRIANIATQNNAKVIQRPAELSADNSTSESALQHAIEHITTEKGLPPDIIVFLQCTSPLRQANDIDLAIEQFIEEEADSLISATKPDDITLWQEQNKQWRSLNFDYKNRGMRQNRTPTYIENGSIYIFTPKTLAQYNNRIGQNLSVYCMEFWQTWEIDTLDEVDLVEFYMKKYLLPTANQATKTCEELT
jgi:CMP-N,N'-diacetyllegionaminic acid synthase